MHIIMLFCMSLHVVVCNDGAVRIEGGSNSYSGRVEVCIREVWGTICQDFWDTVDAGIVCKQLGYSRFSMLPIQLWLLKRELA